MIKRGLIHTTALAALLTVTQLGQASSFQSCDASYQPQLQIGSADWVRSAQAEFAAPPPPPPPPADPLPPEEMGWLVAVLSLMLH